MRRVLVDRGGQPVYPSPGMSYEVVSMKYRFADDGDPDGDILIVVTEAIGFYTPMHQLPITSVR